MESLLREIPLYFRLLKVCKCKQITDTKGCFSEKCHILSTPKFLKAPSNFELFTALNSPEQE